MAVWQYKGEFVPELWLIAEHGRIPDALEDYLMTEDTDLDAIEDPHWWRDAEIPSDLIKRVSAIMPQTKSWTEDALMFGDDKRSALEDALKGDEKHYPVRRAIDGLGARLSIIWAP